MVFRFFFLDVRFLFESCILHFLYYYLFLYNNFLCVVSSCCCMVLLLLLFSFRICGDGDDAGDDDSTVAVVP